ncbi:MAG: hypothetical protein V2I33_07360 [Kangiellaceae bacterium]|jgi:hypothetical protein|nr:hypothetical protein [Kangiellaceae bacterium]
MPKYRVQINAQATVYEKTGRKVMEETTISGLVVPNQVDEEREFECKQLAVAFTGTQLKESEVDEKLKQLAYGVKQTLIDKGLII